MTKKDKKATVVSKPQEERVEIPKISFEAYVKEHRVNPGLVASFSYEAQVSGEDLTENRTSEEWKKALDTQANRAY